MSTLARDARLSYAFVERNFNLVKRYWGLEIAWLVYSVAHALAIGFIGVGMERVSGQPVDTGQVVLYLMVGSLVWSYLAVVFECVGETIAWERWEETIEYTFMAPVHRFVHMIGSCLFGVAFGVLRTGVILTVVVLVFKLDLSRSNLPSAALVLAIGSISFMGLGIMVSALPLLFPERGAQMIFIAQSCLLLISGVYYPIEVLPSWMQAVSIFSPATYSLEAIRQALIHGRGPLELTSQIVPLIVIGGVSIPLGLKVFVTAERFAKRTGRLKRSG